jgi:calcineurin-like phosphoesterase family protein
MDWFTADQHLGHKNIAKYENRPDGWEDTIINNWNNTVAETDTVYVLGDFSFRKAEETAEILSILNGTKILICGNHDKSPEVMKNMGFAEVYGTRKRAGYNNPFIHRYELSESLVRPIALSHAPLAVLPVWANLNLHGHIHSNPVPPEIGGQRRWHMNVSVDVTEFKLVSSFDVLKFIISLKELSK